MANEKNRLSCDVHNLFLCILYQYIYLSLCMMTDKVQITHKENRSAPLRCNKNKFYIG